MAAFLHVAIRGTGFAEPELGAGYTASPLRTAALEVGNEIPLEIAPNVLEQKTEELREYTARLFWRLR